LVLVNTGDATTQLSLVADDGTPELGHGLPQTVELRAGDTLRVPIDFAPTQPQPYSRHLLLRSSWALHPPITVTLQGEGTAPAFQAEAIDFDTVLLQSWRDTVATVLLTSGNEPTVIDTLWLEGPHATDFAILASPGLPIRLAPGSSLRLSLRFLPQQTGYRTAYVVLHHNGQPPALSDTVHVPLRGYGKALPPVDTFAARWSVRLEALQHLIACRDTVVQLCLRNEGNTDLLCYDAELMGGLLRGVEPPLPQRLQPHDSLCLRLLFSGLPAGQARLRLRLQLRSEYLFNDTLRTQDFQWEGEFSVTVHAQQWRLTHVDTLGAEPGKTALFHLGGVLPAVGSSVPSGTLCIAIPPSVWSVIPEAVRYEVIDQRGTHSVPVPGVQEYPWGWCFRLPSFQPVEGELIEWHLWVPVQAFVGTERTYAATVTLRPDSLECVGGDTAAGIFALIGLCSPQLRAVRLQEAALVSLHRLFPQPAGEVLEVELSSGLPTTASLQIWSLQGEMLAQWSLSLPRGVVLRKFELTGLPSGVYSLRLLSPFGTQQRMVVIQR
jgi:hypothetical protein